VWIFFNGDEESTDGEDGSTCANVRFGIRQCLLKGIGVALHWQCWPTEHARRRRANSARVTCTCTRCHRRAQRAQPRISTTWPRFWSALIFTQGPGTETVNIQSECKVHHERLFPTRSSNIEPPSRCTPPRFSLLFLSTGTYVTNLGCTRPQKHSSVSLWGMWRDVSAHP
jgi:hypothetical protein